MSYTLIEILGGRITDYRGSTVGTFEIHAVPNEAFTAADGTIVQPKNYRIIPVTATTTSQTAGLTTMSIPQLVFGNFVLYANDNAVVNKFGTYRFELWHNGRKLYTLSQYNSVKIPSDVNSISWITLATYNNPLGLPNVDQTVFSKEQTLSLLGGMVDQSGRITALETEVWSARNAYPSIDTRMDAMDASIASSASASALASLQADVTAGHANFSDLNSRFNALNASVAALTLDNLSDVVTPTPASGNFLHYDGHNWTNTFLAVGDIPNNIPATKIFDGSISDVEFSYLDGLTGNIQAQFNTSGVGGSTGFTANTNAKRDANAALSASQYFVGNTDVNLQRVVVDLSRGFTQTGLGVYNDTTTANPGILLAHRLYVGEQPGDNPQGALYSDGIRITQKWYGNPAVFDKFQGLYVYNSIQDLTSGNTSSQDIYGVDAQTGIYDVAHDTHVPTAYNIWTVYGGHFIAYHQSPGNISDGMIGVMGKSWEYSNATTPANVAKHRGVQGWAATMAGSNSNTTASRGVYGILENNGTGTMTEGSGGYFFINTNNGVITTASGVRIGNVNINGSGTSKYGLFIESQGVSTPGNWTTVANIYSAGSTSINIFDGQIKSNLATGTSPFIIASTTLVTNLNADYLGGNHAAAFSLVGHTHVLANISDAGTAAAKNVPSSGNAALGEVVLGSDTRLSDARTPLAHTHAISDVINLQTTLDAKVVYNATRTLNRITKWTNVSTKEVGDSLLSDDGTNVNLTSGQLLFTTDTGIKRNAAGTVKVTDGGAGTGNLIANLGSFLTGVNVTGLTTISGGLTSSYNSTGGTTYLFQQTWASGTPTGFQVSIINNASINSTAFQVAGGGAGTINLFSVGSLGGATLLGSLTASTSILAPSHSVTAPSQAVTTTAGSDVSLAATNAVAGSATAGAAAGGNVNINAGNATQLTSGNANGGNINLNPGAGVGTGVSGNVTLASGQLSFPNGTVSLPSIALNNVGTNNTGIFLPATNRFSITVAGTETMRFVGSGQIGISSGTTFGFSSSGAGTETLDTILLRDAANTLALRNAANAQTLRVYNTFTDTSNYARAYISPSGTTLSIGTEGGGTGVSTLNSLNFLVNGSSKLNYNFSVSNSWAFITPLTFATDNTYDIGASGATRPRNIFIAGNGTFGGGVNTSGSSFFSGVIGLGGNNSFIDSASSNNIRLRDNSLTGFGLLQFGGITSSFPAIKRNAAAIDFRLADDSAYANINVKGLTANGQYYSVLVDNGNSGTTKTIDFSTGNTQKVTLNGNVTFTFTNAQSGGRYIIELVQDATGSRTVTWPAAVKWSGGTAPTLTTTAGKIDLISLFYDGTNYYAGSNLNF